MKEAHGPEKVAMGWECRDGPIRARIEFSSSLLVFLGAWLACSVALEALEFLEQSVHLVFEISEPALDARVRHGRSRPTHGAWRSVGSTERARAC